MSTPPPPPGWYPDQARPDLVRWWDGNRWTDQVRQAGPERSDIAGVEFGVDGTHDPAAVSRQAQRATGGGPVSGGGGTLFTEPVLVVNQKAKLMEVVNEYQVFDQHGNQIGAVQQVGQSGLMKAVRMLSKNDQMFTVNLEVRDANGQPVLRLHRPRAFFKSTVSVQRPDGSPIGEIVQENLIGKIRFALVAGGQQVGSLNAQNWRAWDFALADAQGREVARITKNWEGFARAMFTTADKYVVQVHAPLADPLASLVLAGALTVDTVLKQQNE